MLMPDDGFVKIYRSIIKWDWYDDANTFRLFFHCILKANYEDKEWHGLTIHRGSFVTSYGKLAKELKLTTDKIRTSIGKLKRTNNITIKSTNKYSVITVVAYKKNQNNPTQNPQQVPHTSHTSPKQIPTTKESKNERKKESSYKNLFKKLEEQAIKEGRLRE